MHAWREEGHPEPLRIRLTAVPAVEGPRVDVGAACTLDDALAAVRDWLSLFAQRDQREIR